MENYFWNTEEKETRKKLYILIGPMSRFSTS